jgi:hypothetical protein
MTACSHSGSSVPLLPRGVRRVLDAMCANVGHDWRLADLADARRRGDRIRSMSVHGVRRAKTALSSGWKSHPGTDPDLHPTV